MVRDELRNLGFVRIDGLWIYPPSEEEGWIQDRMPGKTIRWDANNGVWAVALPNGEVWVTVGDFDDDKFKSVVADGERGMWVPLSNGEQVSWRELLRRMRDPDWVPDYVYAVSWRP